MKQISFQMRYKMRNVKICITWINMATIDAKKSINKSIATILRITPATPPRYSISPQSLTKFRLWRQFQYFVFSLITVCLRCIRSTRVLRSYISADVLRRCWSRPAKKSEGIHGVWRTHGAPTLPQSASAQQTLLHHFRYKIDIRDWPWHISQRDRDIASLLARQIFDRDSNNKHRIRPSSGRFFSSCRLFLSSCRHRVGRDSVVFSRQRRQTSLRNANWKAEGTVHVRDYLPRSTNH